MAKRRKSELCIAPSPESSKRDSADFHRKIPAQTNFPTDTSYIGGGSAIISPTYYNGSLATATWQGAGSVWAAGSNNWTMSGGSAYTWVNQETAATFNAGGNNNVTISGPAIAHSLTFSPSAIGYVFSGGTLTVTAGGVTANESVTINSPFTVGAPQTWTTAAGKALNVNGAVHTIISTLSVAGAGATNISGVIDNGGAIPGNGGGLTMNGPGTLTLTGLNTYTNATLVSGGALVLSGGSGAIAASSGIAIAGGKLLLDNSALNNPNRIANTIGVALQGGEMSLTGNTAGTVETIGPLSLLQGGSTITVSPASGPAGWSTSGFSRNVGGAALVRGPGLGSGGSGAVGQIVFSAAPALSSSGTGAATGVLPYFFGDASPTGNGTDLVTYGSYGLCLLSGSQYSSSVAANTNVKLASSPAAISGNTSILALVLTNSGSATQVSINSGKTLTLASGALLSAGSAANSISGGTLTFGANSATSYEGIIHTASNLTIGSAVTNDGTSAVSLTKSGPGMLVFGGPATYSGGTSVGAGTLQVAAGGSLVSGGAVTVSGGGAFSGSPAFNVSGGTVSMSNSGSAFYLGGAAAQTGVVNVSAGSVAASNGNGVVLLGDLGTGIWNQTGGTTSVAGEICGANQAGSAAQLNVSGGCVSAGNRILLTQSGSGTLNLSGSGLVTTPCLAVAGNSALSIGMVNLNGGTLAVGGVQETYNGSYAEGQLISGLATFNFNGGLLRATTSSTTFLEGLDYAYVQSGGALIDTQGFNDTIAQALANSSSGGAPSGSGGLTKFGSGTLTLTASNTYTGLTTVNGGVLQLGDGTANTGSVTGNVALANTATLSFANPAALTYANSISGTGNLVKTGAGVLTLSGTNTYSGRTAINAGALVFSTSSSAPPAVSPPDISIAAGATLGASGPYATVTAWLNSGRIANSSAGALAMTVSSSETINLATGGGYASLCVGSIGTNTYTGTLTPVGSAYYLGSAGGTLVMPNNAALVDSGSGSRNLVVNGGLTLAGSNTYSGGTTLNPAGQLNINNAAAIGGGALTIVGGTLGNSSGAAISLANNVQNWNGDFAFAGPNNLNLGNGAVTMNSSRTVTLSAGSLSVGGPISGTGAGLTVAGTGTLLLGGSNTFGGPLNLNGGVLNFANSYNLGNGTAVNFNGGTLQYAAGNSYNMAGWTLAVGAGYPPAGGGTIDPGSNSNVSLAANLSGAGTLYKAGTNALTYSGTSSAFTGTIQLAGGTCTVAPNANITKLGGITQNNGTNVTWNVNGTLGATTVAIAPGSTANWGGNSGVLNVNSGGNMTASTMNLAYQYNFVGNSNATVNVKAGGTLTATNMLMSFVSYGYQTAASTINVNGVLNVNNLTGVAPGAAYGCSVTRIINVNAGGVLNATTIDLSQSGGGTYTRQLNLNSATLANLAGTDLTVDSTTPVTITGNNTFWVSAGNSMTVNGPIAGPGGFLMTGGGVLAFNASSSYSGPTTVNGGTLNFNGGVTLSSTAAVVFNNPGALIANAGSQTISSLAGPAGSLFTLASGTLTTGGDNTSTTFAGNLAIAASGGLIKTGGGTFTLSGANTYSGPTAISNGALTLDFSQAGSPAANILPSGTPLTLGGVALGLIGGPGAVNSQALGNLTFNGVSTVTLTPNGATALSMTAGNAWTRNAGSAVNFTLNGGTLASSPALNSGGILVGSGSTAFATVNGTDWATVSGGSLAAYAGYNNDTYAGANVNTNITAVNPTEASAITCATLAFRTAQANTLTLTGSNALSAGGLLVGSQVGGNNTTISGGTLTSLTNDLVIQQFNPGGGLTINSRVANHGSHATELIKAGPGTLVLAGTNTYTGATIVGGGSLQGTLTSIPTAVTLQNGANVNYNVTSSGTLNTSVGGNGSFTKSGSGFLTIGTTPSYLGATVVSGGTLGLKAGTGLPATTAVNIAASGAVLNLNGVSLAIGSLSGATGGSLALGAATLTTGNDNTNTTFSGAIAGGGSLVKVGGGTFTLCGPNAYSGTTTVNNGTLLATTTASLPGYSSAGKIIFNGGTLAVNVGGGSDWPTAQVNALLAAATTTNGDFGAGHRQRRRRAHPVDPLHDVQLRPGPGTGRARRQHPHAEPGKHVQRRHVGPGQHAGNQRGQ